MIRLSRSLRPQTPLERLSNPVTALTQGRPVAVLENGPNPTTDYYIGPRVPDDQRIHLDLASDPRSAQVPSDALVVAVRYVESPWLDWLAAHAGPVALLLDDDLDAVLFDMGLALRYRRKIWRRHHAHLKRLRHILSALWVSTPEMARRYPGAAAILPPALDRQTRRALKNRDCMNAPGGADSDDVHIVYAATGSHRRELAWLRPVMKQVLAARPRARLTVVSSGDPCDYGVLPRTHVAPQTPWRDYRRSALSHPADIFLNPLLNTSANHPRSETKFFDAVRLGAAGIYSPVGALGVFARHGEDCLIAEMDSAIWAAAILRLIDDAPLRRRLAQAAQKRALGG